MSRKVLRDWGCPLSHFSVEAAPYSGKNSWSLLHFSPTTPLPLLMTDPLKKWKMPSCRNTAFLDNYAQRSAFFFTITTYYTAYTDGEIIFYLKLSILGSWEEETSHKTDSLALDFSKQDQRYHIQQYIQKRDHKYQKNPLKFS
jgi:hypothetical protein